MLVTEVRGARLATCVAFRVAIFAGTSVELAEDYCYAHAVRNLQSTWNKSLRRVIRYFLELAEN